MEIEYINRDQLSDFYRRWVLVTYADMLRYLNDGPVSIREAIRDLCLIGLPTYHEDYLDARTEAVRWSRSMNHMVVHGDSSFSEDIPDPDEIEEEIEEESSWNVNVFFKYLTANIDLEIPSLPPKKIRLLGIVASRCFPSLVERHLYYVSKYLIAIPQTLAEAEALKDDEGAVSVLRDGGLFIEASAFELFKRRVPDWKVFIENLPQVTKVVF